MPSPLHPYTDLIQLVLDIRRHTLMPGHEVGSVDRSVKERMFWLQCEGCAALGKDTSWFFGTKAVKALRDRSEPEAHFIGKLLSTHKGRLQMVEYLNNRINFDLPPVVDRYHRPWVI